MASRINPPVSSLSQQTPYPLVSTRCPQTPYILLTQNNVWNLQTNRKGESKLKIMNKYELLPHHFHFFSLIKGKQVFSTPVTCTGVVAFRPSFCKQIGQQFHNSVPVIQCHYFMWQLQSVPALHNSRPWDDSPLCGQCQCDKQLSGTMKTQHNWIQQSTTTAERFQQC
jgi:hypothetical protein